VDVAGAVITACIVDAAGVAGATGAVSIAYIVDASGGGGAISTACIVDAAGAIGATVYLANISILRSIWL
jgi:hypothetical protein